MYIQEQKDGAGDRDNYLQFAIEKPTCGASSRLRFIDCRLITY